MPTDLCVAPLMLTRNTIVFPKATARGVQGGSDAGCGKGSANSFVAFQLKARGLSSTQGEGGYNPDLWYIRHREVHSGLPSGPKVGHLHDHVDRFHSEYAEVSFRAFPPP